MKEFKATEDIAASLSGEADILVVDEGPKAYCIRWDNPDTGAFGYSADTITKKEAEDLISHLQSDMYKASVVCESASGLATVDGTIVSRGYDQHKHPQAFPSRVATIQERDEHEQDT